MHLKRKNSVAVLKYKLIFEEYEIAVQEQHEGGKSLAAHLMYFRDKLQSQNSKQLNSFDKTFFGSTSIQEESSREDNALVPASEEVLTEANSHPSWAKKLYKKIALSTHPDKISQIKIDSLQDKLSRFYLLAVDSYKACEYQNLIMIAADLGMSFDQELIKQEVVPAIEKTQKKVRLVYSDPGYLWYHVPEENKKSSLKLHLESMGFDFTEGEIDEAIKSVRAKNERRTGVRPVKSRRMRLK